MASFKVMVMPPFWPLEYVLLQFRGFQTIINRDNPKNRNNPRLQKGHHGRIPNGRWRIMKPVGIWLFSKRD